jgi:hypothetical protein
MPAAPLVPVPFVSANGRIVPKCWPLMYNVADWLVEADEKKIVREVPSLIILKQRGVNRLVEGIYSFSLQVANLLARCGHSF